MTTHTHTDWTGFFPNAYRTQPCHSPVRTALTHSKWTDREREGWNVFYMQWFIICRWTIKLLPPWPEQLGRRLNPHSVPRPALPVGFPEPRCSRYPAAVCVDHDGCTLARLRPAGLGWVQMWSLDPGWLVMEGQLDSANVFPGTPTGPEVRARQGHRIQIEQGVIAVWWCNG